MLLEEGVHPGHQAARLPEALPRPLPEPVGEQEERRDHREGHERQLRVEGEHHPHDSEKGEDVPEDRHDARSERHRSEAGNEQTNRKAT